MAMELDSSIGTIRDGARAPGRLGCAVWAGAIVVLGMGAVRPIHQGLLAMGGLLLVAAVITSLRRIREHRAARRIAAGRTSGASSAPAGQVGDAVEGEGPVQGPGVVG